MKFVECQPSLTIQGSRRVKSGYVAFVYPTIGLQRHYEFVIFDNWRKASCTMGSPIRCHGFSRESTNRRR